MISSSKLLKDKDNKKNLLDVNRNSKRCQKSSQKPPTSTTSQPNALLTPTYNILCRRKICLCIKRLINLSGNGSLILCIILKFEENPSKEGYRSQSQVYIISLLSLQRHLLSWSFFHCFQHHTVCPDWGSEGKYNSCGQSSHLQQPLTSHRNEISLEWNLLLHYTGPVIRKVLLIYFCITADKHSGTQMSKSHLRNLSEDCRISILGGC